MASLFRRIKATRIPLPAREAVGTLGTFLSIASCGLIVQTLIVDYQGGSGPSMIPTLPDEGSVTIASRLHRYGRNVKVGDIVWAQSPYFQHANVCKRVIGMPGDYVVLDKDCSPYIGGAPILDKPSGGDETGRDEPVMIEVPEGHVWLAGDNLPYSRDSRKYGPMPMGLINGKIIAAGHGWLNFGSWQWFGDRDQLVSQEVIENRGLVKTARAARYKEKE